MPRNGSGSYSLPQPPFVPGTVISSAAVNSDFSDIATALTSSVSSDGQTSITGALKSSLGASGPAFTSSADTTSGFGAASGAATIYVASTSIAAATAAGLAVTGNLSATGNLSVTGNASITGNLSVTGNFAFTGTGAVNLPDGTTGQRPSPTQSMVRYNSTLSRFEGYDGTEWVGMSNIQTGYAITASVNSNILTINILNSSTAAAPTAADPLALVFRDPTLANGDSIVAVASSALTMTTNATGATLGTSNSVPFRFWIVAFNNSGTIVPALINCSTTVIFPLNEGVLQSATGISNAATSAGVFYCPNGTTITSQPFRILGYLEYASGLATAGSYASVPTILQLFGPGIRKPGDIVQSTYSTSTGTATVSGATPVTVPLSTTISPTSAVNPIRVTVPTVYSSNPVGSVVTAFQLARSAVTVFGNTNLVSGGTYFIGFLGIDRPGATTATTYNITFTNSGNTSTWNVGGGVTSMIAEEIMG